MTRWTLCHLANLVCCSGCFLLAPFLVLLRWFSLDGETQIWPGGFAGSNIGIKQTNEWKKFSMKHTGLIRKTANRITQAQQKTPKPKDDTQIPRPDLRFAIERKQRSKTKNGARAQTKHPEQKHKICQVTQGECPTVSSKTCTTNQLKSSSMARQTVWNNASANCH